MKRHGLAPHLTPQIAATIRILIIILVAVMMIFLLVGWRCFMAALVRYITFIKELKRNAGLDLQPQMMHQIFQTLNANLH